MMPFERLDARTHDSRFFYDKAALCANALRPLCTPMLCIRRAHADMSLSAYFLSFLSDMHPYGSMMQVLTANEIRIETIKTKKAAMISHCRLNSATRIRT